MSDQRKIAPESRWVDIVESKTSDPNLLFASMPQRQRQDGGISRGASENAAQLDGLVWVDGDTEHKLLKDLLFVFQVGRLSCVDFATDT
jgi:hypothetical protein